MTIYDSSRKTASRLFAKFAQGDVLLRRAAPAAGDPWSPAAGPAVDHPLDATVSGVSARYVDGTLVTASDFMVRCAVPPVAPDPADMIVVDGAPRAILKIQPVPAAGAPVAYLIFVKG